MFIPDITMGKKSKSTCGVIWSLQSGYEVAALNKQAALRIWAIGGSSQRVLQVL